MATFTEFYCQASTGSNLNGGSDAGSPSMSDTAGTGSWTSTTNVYVSVATTGAVTVGQFMSIYSSGASVAAYTARITAVSGGSGSAWVITLSATAFSGSKPATASTYFAQVGGAWQGPTGAIGFPIGYITGVLTGPTTNNYPRVNLLNSGGTYSITAAMTQGNAGPLTFQGAASTPGDGGKATISGPITGASFVPLTVSGTEPTILADLVVENNGNSGTSVGINTASSCILNRIVVNNVRSTGFSIAGSTAIQCEAYACNQSNTAGQGGFVVGLSGCILQNCISHHNAGSSNCGFVFPASGSNSCVNCIADSNGLYGFYATTASTRNILFSQCTANNNGTDGIHISGTSTCVVAYNCILTNNTTTGINNAGSTVYVKAINCAYYNNPTQAAATVDSVGAITLTGTPFVSSTTGNFALNNTAGAGAACRAAGYGSFTQTDSTDYSATTTSFPDVGAAQVSDAGGGGGGGGGRILKSSIIAGGRRMA